LLKIYFKILLLKSLKNVTNSILSLYVTFVSADTNKLRGEYHGFIWR